MCAVSLKGSVRRLDESCELLIKRDWQYFEGSLAALPKRLFKRLNSSCDKDGKEYEIIYPTAADFD